MIVTAAATMLLPVVAQAQPTATKIDLSKMESGLPPDDFDNGRIGQGQADNGSLSPIKRRAAAERPRLDVEPTIKGGRPIAEVTLMKGADVKEATVKLD